MPVFQFKAYDAGGKVRKGTIDEESRRAALDRLQRDGLVPISVAMTRSRAGDTDAWATFKGLFRRGLSLNDVALFTRQMATMLGAGLPLVDSLTATLEQVDEESRLHQIVASVRDGVNEGQSFAEALRRQPSAFNDLYVNMVAAGEQSGALEVVMERLADFLDSQIDLRNQVLGTLAYPAIMFVAMLGVVVVLFVFVIPKLVQVFEQTGQELPLPTRILLGTADFLDHYGMFVVFMVFAAFVAFRVWTRRPKGRAIWDRVRLRLPIVGPVVEQVALSRFARTLATLLTSGVPLVTSLRIVREVVGNVVFAKAIDRVHDAVVEGGGLAGPLRRTEVFPPALVRMVSAGEQSGELETMLTRVAMSYDREVAVRLTVATRLLEPLMILVMGGLVFSIMLSILVPMFRINQMVG